MLEEVTRDSEAGPPADANCGLHVTRAHAAAASPERKRSPSHLLCVFFFPSPSPPSQRVCLVIYLSLSLSPTHLLTHSLAHSLALPVSLSLPLSYLLPVSLSHCLSPPLHPNSSTQRLYIHCTYANICTHTHTHTPSLSLSLFLSLSLSLSCVCPCPTIFITTFITIATSADT